MSQDSRFGPAPDAVDSPETDGFALAALICALPGLVPFAVLFGIIALLRIQVNRRSGRGLAIAALVISGVWLVGGILVVFLFHGQGQEAAPATSSAETTRYDSVFVLQADDCFDWVTAGGDVRWILCDDPHDEQIFARVALDGTTWRGTATLENQIRASCREQASAYFTISQPRPDLQVKLYVPTERDWEFGTHYGSCSFASSAGKLTGSVPR